MRGMAAVRGVARGAEEEMSRHERRRQQNTARHLWKHPNPPPSVQQKERVREAEEAAKLDAMTDEERDEYLRHRRAMLQAAMPALMLLAGGMGRR